MSRRTTSATSPHSTTNHQDIPRPTQEAKSVGRGECIPDLARTGGAGGACNPHVVGPHRRTVSECAETGAPGVPTIRCRSVRPGALAARTAGWARALKVFPRTRGPTDGGWRRPLGRHGGTMGPSHTSTPPLSQEPRAPATVAARGRTQAYAMRFPLLSCESLTCLLHDSARAAAVVGAWNGPGAPGMHTSAPPSRGNRGEGKDRWRSRHEYTSRMDKWMRSQPSAREAMCGAQLQV